MEFNAKLKKILLAATIALGFMACQNKNVPGSLIPKEQMGSILEDIHYAQAKLEMENLPQDSLVKEGVKTFDTIFKLHHVDVKQFLDSFDYYTAHPEIMDDMYQNMINEMSKNISTYPLKTRPTNRK